MTVAPLPPQREVHAGSISQAPSRATRGTWHDGLTAATALVAVVVASTTMELAATAPGRQDPAPQHGGCPISPGAAPAGGPCIRRVRAGRPPAASTAGRPGRPSYRRAR